MVEKVMKELEKELDMVQVSNDGRLVSPWLLTTRWHEYVAAFDTPAKEIRGRVALPQPDKGDEEDFRTLKDMVEAYFQEAVSLIDSMDELVLQRLNSPDPMKQ